MRRSMSRMTRPRYPLDHKFKVYTAGQKRRVTPQMKREFKRRAAIESVIGHLKEHHRMGRNYLAHASGDAINAVLAAAGRCGRLDGSRVPRRGVCRWAAAESAEWSARAAEHHLPGNRRAPPQNTP